MIVPCCTHHTISLNIGFWYSSFEGNNAFSILVLSTKKRYSNFQKKVFVFQKNYFKVKVFKTFKSFTDYPIKTCWSLKQKAILKIPSAVFRRTCALSVAFKMKPLKKEFSSVKTKTNSNFAVELAEKSNHSFLLPSWWITFFQTSVLLTHDNRMYRT